MAHRQDPMGEVRALEGSRAPDYRAQLIARFASNLELDESEALVLELLQQHGVELLERVDDLPHQDVKALVLGLIQRSQTLSWTEVVGAHAKAHDHVRAGQPCPHCGATLRGSWTVTSVDEDYNWDDGDLHTFTDCSACGAVFATDPP